MHKSPGTVHHCVKVLAFNAGLLLLNLYFRLLSWKSGSARLCITAEVRKRTPYLALLESGAINPEFVVDLLVC